MTSISDARSALASAVSASPFEVDPPACYVFSSGSELESRGGSSVEWQFRVTCAVGIRGDNATASSELAALVVTKLAILWALPGWRVLSVGPDSVRTIAGGDQFTADIAVSIVVQL